TTTITDIDQISKNAIALFPNPLTAGQSVTISGESATAYTCIIRSITGAFIAQQQFVGSTCIHNLPAGLYMITLTAENYNDTIKLLVE
ncbi:MAG: T9SS type A sorting domain-containing protein, partial [Bacteroidales bacterium]|nr:T9SS type A sorting domain-containing protein [Bacteroidales bacterium]